MKSLRKSLNVHKEPHITSPLPPLSKPTFNSLQPPKKVIRALASHKAHAPQELSFEKGDFFHVVGDVGQGQWYEAHNPISGARGLVPCNLFEEFAKGYLIPWIKDRLYMGIDSACKSIIEHSKDEETAKKMKNKTIDAYPRFLSNGAIPL